MRSKGSKISVIILFPLGFLFGLLLWNHIFLPYSNPYGVIGPLSLIQFNPLNNLLRFGILILMPSVLLLLYFILKGLSFHPQKIVEIENYSQQKDAFTRLLLPLFLLLFIVSILPENVPYKGNVTPLDTFHEGETLGSATEIMAGKIPFKETVFIHGIFQDPYRSVLAFKIFGRSIAAERTIETLLHVITFFTFFLTLFFIFKRNILATLWAIFLLHIPVYLFPKGLSLGAFPFFFPPRDLIPLVYVIISLKLLPSVTQKSTHSRLYIYSLTSSFLSLLSLFYSTDRGYFLIVVTLLTFPLITFTPKRSGKAKFLAFSFWILGYILGFVFIGAFIKWSFKEYITYTFWILPRTNGFLNEYVYPIFKTFHHIPVYMGPILLISLNLYWWFFRLLLYIDKRKNGGIRFGERLERFLVRYHSETLLLFLSIFYYKGALGRSGLGHIHTYSGFTFILTTYIFVVHYFIPWATKHKEEFFRKFTYGLMIFFLLSTAIPSLIRNIKQGNYSLPIGIEDDAFIPENYKRTIKFFKENSFGEDFVTLTSEGSWYYFLSRPCPTRFPVVFLACTNDYQEEFVREMERKKVKYVLFKNSSIYNRIDGIPNEVRLPIIFNYVKSHYKFFKKIDDQEIWIRKEFQNPSGN